jgi:hypothetical protein
VFGSFHRQDGGGKEEPFAEVFADPPAYGEGGESEGAEVGGVGNCEGNAADPRNRVGMEFAEVVGVIDDVKAFEEVADKRVSKRLMVKDTTARKSNEYMGIPYRALVFG